MPNPNLNCPKIEPLKSCNTELPFFDFPGSAVPVESKNTLGRSAADEQGLKDLENGMTYGRARSASSFFPSIKHVDTPQNPTQALSPSV